MKCGHVFQIFPLNSVFHIFFCRTLLNAKIFSAYSYLFMRIRRTQGNFLSVYGEYGEFRVVCGAVHKIFSEYAERIYAYIEKTPRDIKLCTSDSLLLTTSSLHPTICTLQTTSEPTPYFLYTRQPTPYTLHHRLNME